MNADAIAWIAAIVAGSIISKMFGLFLRSRDPGMVLGPLLGVAGAAAGWTIVTRVLGHDAGDWTVAALAGAVGGALMYIVGVIAKSRPATRG